MRTHIRRRVNLFVRNANVVSFSFFFLVDKVLRRQSPAFRRSIYLQKHEKRCNGKVRGRKFLKVNYLAKFYMIEVVFCTCVNYFSVGLGITVRWSAQSRRVKSRSVTKQIMQVILERNVMMKWRVNLSRLRKQWRNLQRSVFFNTRDSVLDCPLHGIYLTRPGALNEWNNSIEVRARGIMR